MIDRERHIGIVSEPRVVDVEAGFLKFFAKATGETDPVYFDDAAARAAGHPSIPVPPTYFFSLHMSRPAKRGDIFDKENGRSEEHTSELQSLMRISYAVFCLKKKTTISQSHLHNE